MREAVIFAGIVLALLAFAIPSHAQEFTGEGPAATDLFRLEDGVIVVEFEHEGDGRFRLRLYERSGDVSEEIADVTGRTRGSRAVRIPSAGSYLLDVTATGPWSVVVRGPAGDDQELDGTLVHEARSDGEAAAGTIGAMDWFGKGFLAGIVAGPVGAGVATYYAGGRPTPLPPELEARVESRGGAYLEAFRGGFSQGLEQRRQRFALRGGMLGSAVFGAILLWQLDLARPGDGVRQPDEPLINLFQVRIGY